MASPNHLSPKRVITQPITIWVFHDNKPGHLNQLEGICNRLAVLIECIFVWKDVHQERFSIKHVFRQTQEQQPTIIMGAGHHTHSSVLLAGFKYGAFTSLIMKPSLPFCFFNAIICPKHDIPEDRRHLLSTFGPINKINPEHAAHPNERNINLILLGGDSKHFEFDQTSLIEQIKSLCQKTPEHLWQLSDSARTPAAILTELKALDISNLHIHQYHQQTLEPLHELLLKAHTVWVTPDSMSMIYEALTAKARVFLFKLSPKKNTRITRQIDRLAQEQYVQFQPPRSGQEYPTKSIPWEADRAARWLLDQFQAWKH